MNSNEAINHVLDSIDGIEIWGTHDDVITTLLAAGTAICGVALLRLDPAERERVLFGIEPAIRNYVNLVLARRPITPKVTNGHAS